MVHIQKVLCLQGACILSLKDYFLQKPLMKHVDYILLFQMLTIC